jgi:hypothetical protein
MGLDMYLKARKCTMYSDKDSAKIDEFFPELSDFKSSVGIPKISEVVADVGYWRKANHIHQWFVENIQDGNDDCGEYYCSREKIQELLDLCMKLLHAKYAESKSQFSSEEWQLLMPKEAVPRDTTESANSMARSLLPTSSGFFFGSTDYDVWYWRNILSTAEILTKCLKLPQDWSFHYCSSW